MSRTYPAIEIQFTPEAQDDHDLHDRLVVGLDDFTPTAIEESASVWRVFFDTVDSRGRAANWLNSIGDARIAFGPLDVDDDDWARRSQADLKPVRVGRIVVTPPWTAHENPNANDVEIVVVPSMGFGTGHHASTRLCLQLLQELPVSGGSVVDVGTGSGVLAIACALLGARDVVALDNDPDAIASASENLALNRVSAPVRLECADFRNLALAAADVVVANLTGELLRRSAGDIVALARRGASIVLSGVMAEEGDRVVAAFEERGATLTRRLQEDEWLGLLLRT